MELHKEFLVHENGFDFEFNYASGSYQLTCPITSKKSGVPINQMILFCKLIYLMKSGVPINQIILFCKLIYLMAKTLL